jgi:hypothetical protein
MAFLLSPNLPQQTHDRAIQRHTPKLPVLRTRKQKKLLVEIYLLPAQADDFALAHSCMKRRRILLRHGRAGGTGQARAEGTKKGGVRLDPALQRSEQVPDLLLVSLPSATGKNRQAAAEEQ